MLRLIRLDIPSELSAGRLVLRSLRSDDVPELRAAVIDNLEHLRPFMPWIADEPRPIADQYALVERWDALRRPRTDWPVGIFVEGVLAGCAGLHQRRQPGALEIGYWVRKADTGRGIATVASCLLTDLAFTAKRTKGVEIWHDRNNTRSRAVPRRLGFELIAEVAAGPAVRSPGDDGTDCRWRVTRDQWLERRPSEASLVIAT